MYLIRNVFRTKPGNAKALVEKFKAAGPLIVESGVAKATRVTTDTVSTFWTVVFESEVESLESYFEMSSSVSNAPKIGEAMKGYMDLVDGGHREVFKIE